MTSLPAGGLCDQFRESIPELMGRWLPGSCVVPVTSEQVFLICYATDTNASLDTLWRSQERVWGTRCDVGKDGPPGRWLCHAPDVSCRLDLKGVYGWKARCGLVHEDNR